MKKQVKVVMLPTEKASDLLLCIKSYTEHINTPAENSDIKGNLRLGYGKYVDKEFYQPQNLYFLSDEEIKEGDWVYLNNGIGNYIFSVSNKNINAIMTNPTSKKIIATTDESLSSLNITKCSNINCEEGVINGINPKICKKCNPSYILLPRPSNEFLKKYCELGGIDKVLVEYNEGNEYLAGIVGNNEIWNTYPNEPKIAPDNTITIYPI